MEGYFQADRGFGPTIQNGREAMPAIDLDQPGQSAAFAPRLEQALGGDPEPDPLFFVECWSIGVPAAIQNLQQRRQLQKDRDRRSPSVDRFHNMRTYSFMRERGIDPEVLASFGAATIPANIADTFIPGLAPPSREIPAPQTPSQAGDSFSDESDRIGELVRPLTPEGARCLLSVAANSTREQVRAAYRKMASLYHPDRLEHETESKRRLGTDRMAAINDAYHLLSR